MVNKAEVLVVARELAHREPAARLGSSQIRKTLLAWLSLGCSGRRVLIASILLQDIGRPVRIGHVALGDDDASVLPDYRALAVAALGLQGTGRDLFADASGPLGIIGELAHGLASRLSDSWTPES